MYGLWDVKSKSWVKITTVDSLCCYGFFDSILELLYIYGGEGISIEEFKKFYYPYMVIIKINVVADIKDVV